MYRLIILFSFISIIASAQIKRDVVANRLYIFDYVTFGNSDSTEIQSYWSNDTMYICKNDSCIMITDYVIDYDFNLKKRGITILDSVEVEALYTDTVTAAEYAHQSRDNFTVNDSLVVTEIKVTSGSTLNTNLRDGGIFKVVDATAGNVFQARGAGITNYLKTTFNKGVVLDSIFEPNSGYLTLYFNQSDYAWHLLNSAYMVIEQNSSIAFDDPSGNELTMYSLSDNVLTLTKDANMQIDIDFDNEVIKGGGTGADTFAISTFSGTSEMRLTESKVGLEGNVHVYDSLFIHGVEVDGQDLCLGINSTTGKVTATRPAHGYVYWDSNAVYRTITTQYTFYTFQYLKVDDTTNIGFNSATGLFTIKETGEYEIYYDINGIPETNNERFVFAVFIDGARQGFKGTRTRTFSSTTDYGSVSMVGFRFDLTVGQTISIRLANYTGTGDFKNVYGNINIEKVD